MSTFGVKQEDKLSSEMGKNALALTSIVANQAKTLTSIVVNKGVQAAKNAAASASKGKK